MPLYCGSKNAASAAPSPSKRSMSRPSILFGRFSRCPTLSRAPALARLPPDARLVPKTDLPPALRAGAPPLGPPDRDRPAPALNCPPTGGAPVLILAPILGRCAPRAEPGPPTRRRSPRPPAQVLQYPVEVQRRGDPFCKPLLPCPDGVTVPGRALGDLPRYGKLAVAVHLPLIFVRLV